MTRITLHALAEALTQYLDNQPEQDEGETLADVTGDPLADGKVAAAEAELERINAALAA